MLFTEYRTIKKLVRSLMTGIGLGLWVALLSWSAAPAQEFAPERRQSPPLVLPDGRTMTTRSETNPLAERRPAQATAAPRESRELSQPRLNASVRPFSDQPKDLLDGNDPMHPPIRTASFQGIKPGVSSIKDVVSLWGEPLEKDHDGDQEVHLYSTDAMRHIEVTFRKGIVRAIAILLDEPFPEDQVREVLRDELQKGKAVLIPSEDGSMIGEVFPEKGVLFLFAPEDAQRTGLWVTQIGIEPVTAEPFVLRAEASMTENPSESLRDLLDATRLDSKDPKAHWLLAQVQLLQGDIDAALLNCEQAIRLDETRPAYHITLAKIYIQMNHSEKAKQYLEETLMVSDRYPHEKVQAMTILGDLYRTGARPDYEAAIEYHAEAIRLASLLQNHGNPTIRLSAKETLFQAHLGTARDIAWGQWNDKETAIYKWLERAKDIADDPELKKTKRISADFPLQLAIATLASQVGMPNDAELEPHVRRVIRVGEEMIAGTNDPILQRKYQWETGLALYDAVQIYQIRGQYTPALKYGEQTVHYMEAGITGRRSDTDLYLLGRLYFRLGAIHAIGKKNHRAAIEWYDRAKPVFERLLPKINPEELGGFGETLVSMGVSYWETSRQEEAIRLTERGLRQIERAVKSGAVDGATLIIPYSNLAMMYSRLEKPQEAKKYRDLARDLEEEEALREAGRRTETMR